MEGPPFVGEVNNRLCGRLSRAEVTTTPAGHWRVLVTGHEAGISHLERLLGVDRQAPRPGEDSRYVLALDRPLTGGELEAIGLAREVLVFRPIDALDELLALDWYMVPPEPTEDGVPSFDDWHHTPAGELNSRGKYWSQSPFEAGRADHELALRMADVIRRHPLYRAARVIVPVPGHDASVRSHSDTLAVRLAGETALPVVRATAMTAVRPEAKEGIHADFTDEFTVSHDSIVDAVVLVVDDVVRSGRSMRAVALACRRAGARVVLGLAAVKTMRN